MDTPGSGGVVLKIGDKTYEQAFKDFLINSQWSILSNSSISGMILTCNANNDYDSPFISTRLNNFGQPIRTILVKLMIMTNNNDTDILDLTSSIIQGSEYAAEDENGNTPIIPFRSNNLNPYSVETQPESFIINEAQIQNYIACITSLDQQTLLNGISPRVFGTTYYSEIFNNENFNYNYNYNYYDDFLNSYHGDSFLHDPYTIHYNNYTEDVIKSHINEVDNRIKYNINPSILKYVVEEDKVEFAKFLHFVGYGRNKAYQERSNIQYSLCFLGMEMLQNAIIEYQFRQEIQTLPKEEEEDEYYKLMQYLVWCCVILHEKGYVHRDLHQGNVMYVSNFIERSKKDDLFIIDYGRVKKIQTINNNMQNTINNNMQNWRDELVRILPKYGSSSIREVDFSNYINLIQDNINPTFTLGQLKQEIMPPGKNMSLAYLQQSNLGLSQTFNSKRDVLIQLMQRTQTQNNNQNGGRADVMPGKNSLSASNEIPFTQLQNNKTQNTTKPQEKTKIFELKDKPFYLDKYLNTKESIDKLFDELTTQFAKQPFLLPGYKIPKLKIHTAIKGGKRKKRSKKSKKKHSRKTKNKKRKTNKCKRK